MNLPQQEHSPDRFKHAFYSAFSFDKTSADEVDITLGYQLNGEGVEDIYFEEHIRFESACPEASSEKQAVLNQLTRLLHQIAGVSYYKTAAPMNFLLNHEPANLERLDFLTTLYKKGLAEFASVNDLDLSTIKFASAPASEHRSKWTVPKSNRILVPFGGGKDSLLSLQLVVEAGFSPTLLVVGPNPVAEGLAQKTSYPLIRVTRTLDPQLSQLNQAGALNGHVPVTAIVSMIAVLVAVREDFSAVVMSNENSANTGTLFGGDVGEVNHQYSKSFEFESLLSQELKSCGLVDFEYFSLLRPFSELSICREFAQRGNHFGEFVSCNANFRRSQTEAGPQWCMRCSKCLFVHLAMTPFLTEENMMRIFGNNPLNDEGLLPLYEALIEVDGKSRPFDCVGGPDESRAAFSMLASDEKAQSYLAVQKFRDHWQPNLPSVDPQKTLLISAEHLVPERFMGAVNAVK